MVFFFSILALRKLRQPATLVVIHMMKSTFLVMYKYGTVW